MPGIDPCGKERKSLSTSKCLLSTHSTSICCYCECHDLDFCFHEVWLGQPMGNFMSAGFIVGFCLCTSSAQNRAWHIGGSVRICLIKEWMFGHWAQAASTLPMSLQLIPSSQAGNSLQAGSLLSLSAKGVLWSCSTHLWAVGNAGELLPYQQSSAMREGTSRQEIQLLDPQLTLGGMFHAVAWKWSVGLSPGHPEWSPLQ